MTVTYTLRIAGLIDGSGAEVIWSSNAAASPSGTVVGCIAGDITITGAGLRPVEPLASSGGLSIPMVYSAALAPLLRTDLAWPGGGLQPPRLALPVAEADTTITLDTIGLANGYIWIGGEVMQITGAASNVYTVTRGIGLTAAREHVWFSTDPAPIVLSRQPTHKGARAVVAVWNGSFYDTVYIGAVEGITSAGSTVTVSLTSSLGALRSRAATAHMVLRQDIPATEATIDVNAFRVTSLLWWRDVGTYSYARVWFGDAWIVCPVNSVPGTTFRATEGDVLQWGVKDVPYPRTIPPSELMSSDIVPTDIEPLFSCLADEPSIILQQLATGSWPPGQAGGLDVSDIGDVTALDAAFGQGILLPPFAANGTVDWWPLPGEGKGTVADFIAAGLCAPLGCALTADRIGRLRVVDWGRVLGGTEPITVDDMRTPTDRLQSAEPLRSLIWRFSSGPITDSVRVNSDYASLVMGGGTTVERTPGWCVEFAPAAFDRLSSLLAIWQYPVPLAPMELARGTALQPGDVLTLSVPTLIGRDGLRGIVGMDALVISVGGTLQRPVDSVTVALTGYTITPGIGFWSASGVVVGIAGDTLTLLMDNLDTASDFFPAGTLCQLVSADGAIIEQLVVDTAAANDITFVAIVATPVIGDRIILAAGDVAEFAGSAYWSRGFQYV